MKTAVTDFYTQQHTHCFSDRVTYGLDRRVFDSYIRQLESAKNTIKDDLHNQLPYITLPTTTEDLSELHGVVERYKHFKDVVIFGTGGSSLGAESLQQIAQITKQQQTRPTLHIITNIDPYTYKNRFVQMDMIRTGFIVISKSGATLETVMQFLTIAPILRSYISQDTFKDCVTFICQPGDSPLRTLADKHNIPVLNHDPNLGGRYSVFSLVGVLPALIVGLSAKEFRHGANVVLQHMLNNDLNDCYPAIGSALQMGLYQHKSVQSSVLLAYSDRLGSLARWWRQLWAESLGKNGQGTSPIYGMGPVDQHSQLQLWLDGPRDKFFTVLSTEQDIKTDPIDDSFLAEMGMEYLQGRSLSDLMQGCSHATYDTLVENGCPTRKICLKTVGVDNMGALMMHYILETVFSAHILGVNPFDQPAVEHSKILTKKYLANMT